MIEIKNKKDCCGCNACGDICAHKAIKFVTDNEGFWAQLSDMMIYAVYALFVGVIGCIIWGAIYTRVKK